ncbi:MAG: glutathione S-transferase family protein [Alphaproteobacteria bacterium]|nr:glutathione S-transferase family protein [Alphaproteobacteria bacterium]
MSAEPAALVFYYAPRTRAGIVHWMLEEVGAPYRIQRLDLYQGEQKKPDFLAVNPMGKVPAITHGEVAVSEGAAICCYLADAFPEAGLAPPIGDPRRGPYLKWLFFGPSCFEAAAFDRMMERDPGKPPQMGYGSFDRVMDVLAGALEPGPWLLGDQFTAADVVIGAGLRWGRFMGFVPDQSPFSEYIARCTARPAMQRADAQEEAFVAEAG